MERHIISNNNSADWESQMMYAERHRDQILQAKKSQETISARENYNQNPLRKKLMKVMAKIALTASLLSGTKTIYDYAQNDSTVDNSTKQIDFQGTSSSRLDNNPDKLDKYELIAEAGNEQFLVELEPEDAIRTNDEDYTYSYDPEDNPTHNTLAKNVDDKSQFFEIKEGPIYKTPNGRIAVKSENLKETMSGKQTGIKFEKDSDEWSVIDVSPNELRVVQDFDSNQ